MSLPAGSNTAPERYAALFIDVPNILHSYPTSGEQTQRFLIEDIDWERLVNRMLASLHANHVVYMGLAYLFVSSGRKRVMDRLDEYLKQGLASYRGKVKTFVRAVKDIDVAIVNDMWECFVHMLRVQEKRDKKLPYEVTILLAGGDGAYTYPIVSMRTLLEPHGACVRLHTFSWGGSLSNELSRESSYIELLETGPSIVRTTMLP